MDLEFAAKTHVGARGINEDAFISLVEKNWALFAVADGLGGHEAGELASRFICEGLTVTIHSQIDFFQSDPKIAMQALIANAAKFMRAKLTKEKHPNARTTCAVVWMNADQLVCAHVGDSRIYLFHENKFYWRSHDHSLVQELVDTGVIAEHEMATHPQQNILYRCVAAKEIPDAEIVVHPPLQKNQLLLLCTDGFWENILPNEMSQLLSAKDLDKNLESLVQTAVKRGGARADNVTVIAARIK